MDSLAAGHPVEFRRDGTFTSGGRGASNELQLPGCKTALRPTSPHNVYCGLHRIFCVDLRSSLKRGYHGDKIANRQKVVALAWPATPEGLIKRQPRETADTPHPSKQVKL
jgi:hypothetical protein